MGPLLLGVLGAVWILCVSDRLPQELASHWNGKGEVDGWMSIAGAAWMAVIMGAVGALIAPLAALLRGQSLLLARVGVGFGVAFGTAMVSVSVAVVAGQLDVADTSQAELAGPVLAGGLAASFALGAAALFLYKPGEVDRTQSAEVRTINANKKASDSPSAVAAQQSAAAGQTLRIKVTMGGWAWVLSIGAGVVTAVSTYFIYPPLALLGVVIAVLSWFFCHGVIVISPDGYKVLAGGFWRIMPLEWHEIHTVQVAEIKAMDYGGWGYRLNGGSSAFIMSSGPAVVMEARYHQEFVASMPDLDTASSAADLINAYLHAPTVKN